MPATSPQLQRRLFGLLWLLGLPGIWALVETIVPQWLHSHGVPLDPAYAPSLLWGLLGGLWALLIGLGVWLSPRVGLAAPVLTDLVAWRSPRESLRRMWLPGMAGGVVGAALLLTVALMWPDSLRAAEPMYSMPLGAKLLYGSLTSELLVRWGLLSCTFWAVWRLCGAPQVLPAAMGWLAVLCCAVLWAMLHWLVAGWLLGALPVGTLLHVMPGKVVFGLLMGFLCWRHGLEAVLLAHAMMDLLVHGLIMV